jgi:peptidoglycan/xylan/chitin deacetylase (PgdA/CDA1 family)
MIPEIIGGAALGAVGFAGYHSLAWRSQFYGRTFIGTPGIGKKLALTYDDGPNDPHTLHLLDVLAKHDVRATFFLIGKFVQQRPEVVARIVAAGHAIGNHTQTHPRLPLLGAAQVRKELLDCADSLANEGFVLDRSTKLFRPPFGLRRPATLRIARELGYTPVMWTVTCWDWKQTTANRVQRHAQRQISGGDVILMHDGGFDRMGADRAHSVIATDRIIGEYKQKGFEFVTVPEMMAASGNHEHVQSVRSIGGAR